MPLGCFAVTTSIDADIPPGILFCLRAEGAAAQKWWMPATPWPLTTWCMWAMMALCCCLTPKPNALDRLKRLSVGRDLPDATACARFDHATRHGQDMQHAQKLLAAAVGLIVGKSEERAVASLFSPGGTHAMQGEFAGANDFEVVAYLIVLPSEHETQEAQAA